jgi:DNA-directed RNA polymerase subunit H (RpoH/RPB5)
MFIAFLTLLSALSISGVAIFYSVIGLATIFPGAFWPVVIMGSVLEIGKLVTASWLYRNWKMTKWLLRTYLTIAVVILSLITSMGIFGFLSKAHLEQNLAEDTVTQRIEIITNKIASENTYIQRQKDIITRAENTLGRVTQSNTGALDIEIQSLKDAEDKFKTLLKVETDTVKDLNDRLKTLDRDVSDVLTSNKSFFNEEKAAADLKASQKSERDQIANNIADAQARIQILKDDYARSTADIQKRIDGLRQSNVTDNSGVNKEIEKAEANILAAQNRIDVLILEREPLQSDMLKLEAEVGPVKYIAALAVDFGWTDSVNTSEAVRWVILIIIVVFDPLAVLLLIAANQSLIRRFPVKIDPPEEIIDLEKPDLDPPPPPSRPNTNDVDPAIEQWNSMIEKFKQQEAEERKKQNEKLEQTVKGWNEQLEQFNSKLEKPTPKPIEIVPVEDNEETISEKIEQVMKEDPQNEEKEDVIPHIDLKGAQNKEEDNTDGFDEAEVKYDMEQTPKEPLSEIVYEPTDLKSTPTQQKGILGTVITDKKGVPLPKTKILSEDERKALLNKFHATHGKFEDMSEEELKKERDDSNRAAFLEAVPVTQDDERNHPPITTSRRAFFQDYVDDVLRGNVTADQLPPEIAKTVSLILSDFNDPPIVEPRGVGKPDVEVLTTEGLKEKFAPEPQTEDRDMTEEELDKLIEGFEDDNETQEFDIIIQGGKKIRVPKKKYVQNEEQAESNAWSKIKELDIPEPEKNDIVIPELKNTVVEEKIETVEEPAEQITPELVIPQEKIKKHKAKMVSDSEYRQRIEDRIKNLITKIENNEIKLKDLSEEDQNLILRIMDE